MRRPIAVLAAAAASLLVAGAADAVNIQETVEMFTHTDLTMKDGTVMHADIVKMNGKTYIMMAVDDLPDYLHQQVIKVMQ
jgi:predicted histidine transporter YuiF (NhaC family)